MDPPLSAVVIVVVILLSFTPAFSQQLRRSSANEQFPWYCKPGHVTVIYVNVGLRWVSTANRFSYTGAVQQNADVKFQTEQDGGGQIVAEFNGATLKCDGNPSMKRKTCTIPRHLRPWTGTITVKILGGPSTSFRMSGKPCITNTTFTCLLAVVCCSYFVILVKKFDSANFSVDSLPVLMLVNSFRRLPNAWFHWVQL